MSKEPSPENAGTFQKTAYERFLAERPPGNSNNSFRKARTLSRGTFIGELT